jgi:hypothetical protein
MPNMPTERDLLASHGCGKGDKERSPGWRANYEDINWAGVSGMVRDGAKWVKRYSQEPIYCTLMCPAHGVVSLTREQCVSRVGSPHGGLLCPKCGADSRLLEFADETRKSVASEAPPA